MLNVDSAPRGGCPKYMCDPTLYRVQGGTAAILNKADINIIKAILTCCFLWFNEGSLWASKIQKKILDKARYMIYGISPEGESYET
jgi:hypothetical protein